MKRLFALFALAFLISGVPAHALDAPQRATLHADILADPVLSQLPPSSDSVNQIIAAYAAAPAVACVGWRSALTPDLARAAIVQGAAQLDNLTAGKRDALLYITQGNLNAADATVRQAIDDLAGTQTALKTALQAAERRTLNRLEKLFAVGSCTTLSPSVMSVEGGISYSEVLAVMGW